MFIVATEFEHFFKVLISPFTCITDTQQRTSLPGVSITKSRSNEPVLKTIAVENKLFDVNMIKEASARSAQAKRMNMHKGQPLSTNSITGMNNPGSISSIFSAPGQVANIGNVVNTDIFNPRTPSSTGTINIDMSFPPNTVQQNTGIASVQTDGTFLGSPSGEGSQIVSSSPRTKFHDQSSLLAMVSEQISKRQQHNAAPADNSLSTGFTKIPSVGTSRMPFTGPASAWDMEPKLPLNLDLKIPARPTNSPAIGRVDLPPPPIHIGASTHDAGLSSNLYPVPLTTVRTTLKQETITPSASFGFDPFSGINIFDVTTQQPAPVRGAEHAVPKTRNQNILETITHPPPVATNTGFNSFTGPSAIAPVPNLDIGNKIQNPTSFLFDPVGSEPKTLPDIKPNIARSPANTNPDTVMKINSGNLPPQQGQLMNIDTTPGLDMTNMLDQFSTQSPFTFAPTFGTAQTLETTPPTTVQKLPVTTPSTPNLIPTSPASFDFKLQIKETAVVTNASSNSSTHNMPTIQYDMTPFQHNENWAIFDPTSLPPGVNFSHFGPIIELPIDSKVQFTSTNQVGFQDTFSQGEPARTNTNSAGTANKNPTNAKVTTGMKEQPYNDVTNLAADGGRTVKTKDTQLVDIYQIGQTKNIKVPALNNAKSLNNQLNAESQINTQYNNIGTVNENVNEPSFGGVITGTQMRVDIPPPPPI